MSEVAASNTASKGQPADNPVYFDNEIIDHLIGIVLDLGAEMWVTKDRMATMEELLEAKGIDLTSALDLGRPSEALQQRLDEERKAMIRRIYGRLYSRYGGEKSESRTAPI